MKRYLSLILAIAATVSAQIVPSTGNVRGPTSATDNAVARYDGTTGKLIQNSGVTIDDNGNLTASGDIIFATNNTYLKGKTSGGSTVSLMALTSDSLTRFIAGVDAGGFQWTNQGQTAAWASLSSSALSVTGNLSVSGAGLSAISGSLNVAGVGTFNKSLDSITTESDYAIRIKTSADDGGLYLGANSTISAIQAIDPGTTFGRNLAIQSQGGNVLIGTTTPTGDKLQVSGSATFSGQVNSGTSTSSGYNNNYNVQLEGASGRLIVNKDSASSSGTIYAGFGRNGSGIGSITQDGTTGVLYNTTSDARLKENVRDVTNSGAIIDGLKPRVFDWKNHGDKDRFGFLAQEVHAVFPQAVKKGDDGEEVTDAWAMDAAKLVPVLVAEVKTLRARVAALEAARK